MITASAQDENLEKQEKVFLKLALMWCLIFFLLIPLFRALSSSNIQQRTQWVSPSEFTKKVMDWTEKNKIQGADQNGIPVVNASSDSENYILGQLWRWYPILKFKKGQTYKIHLSTSDLQHGFNLTAFQVKAHIEPGHEEVFTMTPSQVGEFEIVCDQVCGIGHTLMKGKIIVEE